MKELINKVVETAYNGKEGHIPSSLSILDILYVIYEQKLNKNFILSKGHATLGLYVVHNHFGLLNDISLYDFCSPGSQLIGHPSDKIDGITASTGSLGHGLPIGVGMALGNKIKNSKERVVVLIGDGEANEGTIWESALLASHHKLGNLCCIMDHNKSGDRAVKMDRVIRKFGSFGWCSFNIDGHNHNAIRNALEYTNKNMPTFICANTIKGHGVKMMENNPEWHHKTPTYEQLIQIKEDLNES